jgi:purine-binding chemotaxis protein CheW
MSSSTTNGNGSTHGGSSGPGGANRSTGRTTRGSSAHSSGGEGEVAPWFEQSVCAFWLGEHCYGLTASLVGEVFVVEACAPVPVAPPEVIGLFNLRGVPVALIDLGKVLELPDGTETDATTMTALVLRTSTVIVGARIRKMEMVVPSGRGLYAPPQGTQSEHPMVAGFLELPERPDLTITLLHPEALAARLNRMRYLDSDDGP